MHETQPNNSNREQPAAEAERAVEHEAAPRPSPRIYVASLADYVGGVLHGVWIDVARDPAVVQEDIDAMLARSQQPGAEEFAIHDYEGFGSCRIHEYDPIDLVARIARGIEEHGQAFAAWAEVNEGSQPRFDDFEAAYLGHYDSVEDYADHLADELGYTAELARLPEALSRYLRFHSDALASDLEQSGDIYTFPNPQGGVWIFDGHA